jgi:hypothetical protein
MTHTLSCLPRLVALVAALAIVSITPTSAQQSAPFKPLEGRWVGDGRLGLKDSPPETVKCRATYISDGDANAIRQTIRCATASGSIEVKGNVKHDNGALSGFWQETMRNISGRLEGQITPRGFRISVKGNDISANMDIVVAGDRQIVEIQFFNSSLIGLTLLLKKG